MTRRFALALLYVGAWIAGMELAVELLFPLAAWMILLSRGAQLLGLAAALVGLIVLLLHPRNVARIGGDPALAALIDAERHLRAYYRELLFHAGAVGFIISLGLAYAFVLYQRVLSTLPSHAYYFAVILATFGAVTLAWFLPVWSLVKEDQRLRAAGVKQDA